MRLKRKSVNKKVEAVKKSEFKKISAVEPMAFDSSSKLFNPEAKVLAASVPSKSKRLK